MSTIIPHCGVWLDGVAADRPQLVRLCARLTGDADVAEDLAHDTLIEAWRNAHKLRDPQGRSPWLSAIARRVCLRWASQRGRDRAHLTQAFDCDGRASQEDKSVPDPCDIEVELERHDLADLLDRALALLPPQTRAVLIARYIHESPHAEIAARLGISDKAVSMRLSRGKLLLHRALATDLKDAAAAYGLCDAREEWRETPIWCPVCGRRHLQGLLTDTVFSLRCPDCRPDPGSVYLHSDETAIHAGVHGFKAALNRHMTWAYDHATTGLRTGSVACPHCARPCPAHVGRLADVRSDLRDVEGVSCRCSGCGCQTVQSLDGLAASHPASRGFWRRHPRIRVVPPRAVEAAGRPALVFGLESITDGARLDLIAARETFEILAIHGAPAADGMADGHRSTPC